MPAGQTRRNYLLAFSLLTFGALVSGGCSALGGLLGSEPPERSEAPQSVVEDPAFETEVLERAKQIEAMIDIRWSKVFIVSDWSTVREPQEKQIVSQNRIVELVGVATADDQYDGQGPGPGDGKIYGGSCYLYRTNAFQQYIGDGKYRDTVELEFEDGWGAFEHRRLQKLDCALVPDLQAAGTASPESP